jgi:hypothetical protein
MARRFSIAVVFLSLLAFASVAAAAEVTYVMKNGDRHSGTLVYHRDLNLGLVVNGREQTYPISEIAAIIYNGGQPSDNELSQLPTSDNPPELERHMLVLRDGRVIHGKVYHWETDSVIIDPNTGGRQTFNAGDIARLYLSGPPARQAFAQSGGDRIAGNAGRGRGYGRGRYGRYEGTSGQGDAQGNVRVEANRRWTDTGLFVQPGERISFSTNGTIEFGKGMTAGPDGNRDFVNRPGYVIREAPVGTLIGRIGNGAPFVIGSTNAPISMRNGGPLFLGVNDDGYEDNSGAFEVSIYRR